MFKVVPPSHCLPNQLFHQIFLYFLVVPSFSQPCNPGKLESESCSALSDSLWPNGLNSPWTSLGQNTRVGSCSLLQGIFPTQGSNPGLLPCRQILHQLSYQGSPRILELDSLSLLQWIFQPKESNQGLLHCWQILYQLSWQGSPFMPKDSHYSDWCLTGLCCALCNHAHSAFGGCMPPLGPCYLRIQLLPMFLDFPIPL